MIELEFHSPSLLNTLKNVSEEDPKQWSVMSLKGELIEAFFDLNAMKIQTKQEKSESVLLKQVYVNEDKNLFFFEEVDDSSRLDFPFASSMFGQILKGKELIDALKKLDLHYQIERIDDKQEIDKNDSDDDKEKIDKEG